jgi:cell division protein ZapA (FtsZ GTPase activity inhibitor)
MMNNDELLIAITNRFDQKVEEVKRYTGVLVEDLRKDIKAIAEGHSVLDHKMDTLHKEMNETKKELKAEINGLATRFDGMEKNMEVVKNYVIGVDAKLNEHERILKRVK